MLIYNTEHIHVSGDYARYLVVGIIVKQPQVRLQSNKYSRGLLVLICHNTGGITFLESPIRQQLCTQHNAW